MSAEAPKQTGVVGFLKRFFASQPDPELRGFASQIRHAIDTHSAEQKRQETKRRDDEAKRRATEVARMAEATQKQRELDQRRILAIAEANEILDEFRVGEKLKYIQKTVWQGKGKIRPIEPELDIDKYRGGDYYDRLGGLELVHTYDLPQASKWEVTTSEGDPSSRWAYSRVTRGAHLRVDVIKQHGSREGEKTLGASSVYYTCQYGGDGGYHDGYLPVRNFLLGTAVPTTSADSKTLLDDFFKEESAHRLTNNLLPSQLEKSAKVWLAAAKRTPAWLKETANVHDLSIKEI